MTKRERAQLVKRGATAFQTLIDNEAFLDDENFKEMLDNNKSTWEALDDEQLLAVIQRLEELSYSSDEVLITGFINGMPIVETSDEEEDDEEEDEEEDDEDRPGSYAAMGITEEEYNDGIADLTDEDTAMFAREITQHVSTTEVTLEGVRRTFRDGGFQTAYGAHRGFPSIFISLNRAIGGHEIEAVLATVADQFNIQLAAEQQPSNAIGLAMKRVDSVTFELYFESATVNG